MHVALSVHQTAHRDDLGSSTKHEALLAVYECRQHRESRHRSKVANEAKANSKAATRATSWKHRQWGLTMAVKAENHVAEKVIDAQIEVCIIYC